MKSVFAVTAVFLLALTCAVRADDVPTLSVHLTNNAFVPQQIELPAHQKVKLMVINDDATPAEFESYDLNREKVVPEKSSVAVFIDPLDPGTYDVFDDFHRETTKAKVVVK